MEALSFSNRGMGLIYYHLATSTSGMGDDLWRGGALLLWLWCAGEMGSQLGGRPERHGERLQWLCGSRTRSILVMNAAFKSLLLGIHEFSKGFPANISVGHQIDTVDSSSESLVQVELKPMD